MNRSDNDKRPGNNRQETRGMVTGTILGLSRVGFWSVPIESVGASGVWSGWVGLYGRPPCLVSKPLPRRLTQKPTYASHPGVGVPLTAS